jgi:hypothetical protein
MRAMRHPEPFDGAQDMLVEGFLVLFNGLLPEC